MEEKVTIQQLVTDYRRFYRVGLDASARNRKAVATVPLRLAFKCILDSDLEGEDLAAYMSGKWLDGHRAPAHVSDGLADAADYEAVTSFHKFADLVLRFWQTDCKGDRALLRKHMPLYLEAAYGAYVKAQHQA